MIDLVTVILFFLVVASLIDFYTKQVPSVFLTGLIVIVAVVNLAEIQFGMIHLTFGIISFIFAYMLYEADFIGGVADIKVITIIGMLCSTIPFLLTFFGLVGLLGLLYKGVWLFVGQKNENDLVPFLPCLLWVFITLWGVGGLI